MMLDTWKRWSAILSVALIAVVVLVACGGGDPPPEEDVTAIPGVEGAPDFSQAPPEEEEAADTGDEPADDSDGAPAGEPVLLEGGDIYWEPTELTVPVGGAIELVNIGAAQHTFAIEGYNEDEPVDMPIGEPVIWEIPADLEPGEYTFVCTVPGHIAAGMVGTLTITEAEAPAEEAPPAAEATPAEDAAATPAAEATPAADSTSDGTPAAEGTPVTSVDDATPVAATPEATPVVEEGAEASVGDPVLLEGGDIYWEQEELTVPVDGVIELVNIGASAHNFAIEGYNDDAPVDMPIGGESVLWEIPDDLEPGTYTFYCEIPGHRAAGMVGTLTITD